MPDLRQLRTFVAVAELLNFTRAAERLHMGQQAVSKSVRQLELELGVELLERTTREVRLTPAGAALLERGRDALAAADAAFAHAQEVGRGLTGTVRVGVSPAIGTATRDEVVRSLRDGAPELSVSLLEVRPREVAQLLRERRVDCVLLRTFAGSPDVDSAALRPTPAALYVPAGHRLARAEPVPLRALDGERLLTWSSPGSAFTDLLLARVAAAGARVEPVLARVIGGETMDEVGERGLVALAPAGRRHGDGVVQLALADELTLPLVLLWQMGAPPEAARRLRERMATHA